MLESSGNLIRRLPPEVFNKIAAGEVVQRPGSVLKELLDNAIDSGANAIRVRLENAGRTLVRVTDNGCGISYDDIRLAFEPHATSKISSSDDLFNIQTLGFRGEALASIASVAQVSLVTKRFDDSAGHEFEIWGGEERSFKPNPARNGTTVSVKNLFFNVPARRAFLKGDQTELRHCVGVFQSIALANPALAFYLETEADTVFDLPEQSLEDRIVAIFGREFKASLIPFSEETPAVRLSGFLGDPKLVRKTRGEQFLFINKRPFQHRYFTRVVMEEYAPWLGEEVFPFFALFFEMPPHSVDINVHPAKLEVKFDDERGLAAIVRSIIKKALFARFNGSLPAEFPASAPSNSFPSFSNSNFGAFSFQGESNRVFSRINHFERETIPQNATRLLYGQPPESSASASFGGNQPASESPTELIPKTDSRINRTFWQLHHSYIVTQTLTGLCLIDQSAAHRRILFEKAMESANSSLPLTQQLLFPQHIEFSASDFQLLKELLPDIERLGFNIQLVSGNAALLSGVPADVEVGDEKTVIQTILASYQEMARKVQFQPREKLAAAIASRLAIPKGKKLTDAEMERLADQLFSCKSPFTDALGKPTIVYISMEELANRFAARP